MLPAPKLTVFVVEDEALIAENLRLTLEDLGYAVPVTCFTYAEAQAAFATLPLPDLVLLDINLSSPDPAHDGLALARQLRALPQPPPFIFLTAYSDFDTIRRATALRPSGYLIKPANPAALFAAIQTAIERGATQQPAPLPVFPPAAGAAGAADTADTAEATAATAAAETGPADFFFVKRGPQPLKVFWGEVGSLEAGKNYVTLRVPALRLSYAVRGSLVSVLEQLIPAALHPQFVRVNRAVCLNARFITGHDADYVYCADERFENGGQAQALLEALPG